MAKKILCGLTIIIFGVLILLGNFDIINFEFVIDKIWPILLIAFGVGNMIDNRRADVGSFIMILIGGYFVLRNYDVIQVGFMQVVFPMILILLGIGIMLPKKENHEINETEMKNTKNDIMLNAVFSSTQTVSKSKTLKKVEVSAIFGGAELNLMDAEAKDGKCVCYVDAIFGGVDIKLPEDWTINMDGLTCIFGGVDDKRNVNKDAKNVLYIKGVIVFGGIDVK